MRPGDRSRVSFSSLSEASRHGRVTRGLGHSVSEPVVGRSLATSGSSYQLAPAPDSVDSPTTLAIQVTSEPVLFLIDNSTAVSHLKKQGGTRSRSLLKLTTLILRLAHDLGIQILPRHITGQLNVLADLASRSGQIVPLEWALSPQAFQWVLSQSLWGPPQVDLFANAMNHRLPRYFSPCPDPEALAIDALRSDWPGEVMYTFPPACVLFQFLQRCQGRTDRRILLVLQWSPQARWVPLLNSLCARPCLHFPLWQGLLRQPHWDNRHQDPLVLHLQLCFLGVSA